MSDHRLSVRTTKAEKEHVKALAKTLALSESEYVRLALREFNRKVERAKSRSGGITIQI